MAARVGIREVAALAGVAVGTVSHYLNHPDKVSAERAERIRTAIDALGFVPNNAGRQLRLGRSSAIAYVAPDVSNPYFAEIAEAVELRAAERGVSAFIANSHRSREREDAYLRFFEQNQVLGLLVSSHLPIEDRLAHVRRRGTPAVLVGQAATSPDQASISLDDVEGGRLATQHLVDLGRRRVAFVGGPIGIKQVADRLTGANSVIHATPGAGLEILDQSDRTIRGGREIGRALAARPADQRPDAVFAVNDLLALGILQELVRAGVRVPREVALIGYDDIEYGEVSLIPLSTIRGRHGEFGEATVDLLFDEIEGRTDGDRNPRFTPTLVERESTLGPEA
ncbi:LacI family DNA-binding transcriptional regulator [Pseudolysinimonas sp.]